MNDLNILIVGAGIAGLTAAGLLKKQGIQYKIIERDTLEKYNKTGYMMGLLPMGVRVLTELNLRESYFQKSVKMSHYEIHKENGDLNKAFDMDFISDDYGPYCGLGREELIDVLLEPIGKENISFNTTVKQLEQADNKVNVMFSNDEKESFHIVIITDGIHSSTRKLLWTEDEYKYYDTHWGGWVAWLENQSSDTYKEYWGAGSFMGMYPVKNRIGFFIGGPNDEIEKLGLQAFANQMKAEIKPEYKILHDAIDALKNTENPFYWEFSDVRTKEWHKGNVVLLGDAAAAFLPTAGVGASMAMDSAAALVDELSRTDAEHIEYGLKLYTKRQQKRVETNQNDSRQLGKMMFVKSHLISAIRDYSIRYYSVKQLAKNITKTIEG